MLIVSPELLWRHSHVCARSNHVQKWQSCTWERQYQDNPEVSVDEACSVIQAHVMCALKVLLVLYLSPEYCAYCVCAVPASVHRSLFLSSCPATALCRYSRFRFLAGGRLFSAALINNCHFLSNPCPGCFLRLWLPGTDFFKKVFITNL